jgi:hypothetical protein
LWIRAELLSRFTSAKLSKKADDLGERARLEMFVARDIYGLTFEEWNQLASTFTFGGDSDSKADLDEIIRAATEGMARLS